MHRAKAQSYEKTLLHPNEKTRAIVIVAIQGRCSLGTTKRVDEERLSVEGNADQLRKASLRKQVIRC